MATNMSLNDSNSISSVTSSFVLNRVKFGIFLALQIPSLACSLYLFSQYAKKPKLRHLLQNHVFIVLLCSSFLFVFILVSASETFFFTLHVRPASNLFCAIWTWIHYSINVGNLILMAFACGERHWLIFRLKSMSTQWIRLTCHYIPLATCMIYPWVFYFVLIFLYPCEPVYDFTQLLCVMPCYFLSVGIGNVDTFLNNWTPIFAIPVLCGALFIRFILQKRRMHIETFRWKRDRKMILQLSAISSLYFFMWAPLQVSTVRDYFWNDGLSSHFEVDYLYTLPYFTHLLYPFVVLLSNPELRQHSRVTS